MKIIDKINDKLNKGEKFYSFEYFPPKTEGGLDNLIDRIERMNQLHPLFIDITWGAGGTTSDNTLFLSSFVQNYLHIDVLMHLTCRCVTKEKIDNILSEAKKNGIRNILALRGDPPQGMQYDPSNDYFQHASELVKYIRDIYGDYFCIGVAGYPATHIESKSKQEDIQHQKVKIDAGADLIVTQLFYDAQEYLDFVKDCREIGITCPILPGLLPIQNYNSFKKITELCSLKVSDELLRKIEAAKNNDDQIKALGIEVIVDICKKLMENGVPYFHFYTLNLEKSVNEVIKILDFQKICSHKERDFPWKKAKNPKRENETVRPIFWSNKSKSYISKTWYWDEYPNGMWGDSRSPAFGDITEHFQSFCHKYIDLSGTDKKKLKTLRKQWGDSIKSIEDIGSVFVNFINGKINRLPWCEEFSTQNEINLIKDILIKLNKKSLLTINSQPSINAVASSDPCVGWGPSNGYVFQKCYIEFFISEENLRQLVSLIDSSDYSSTIVYQAVNLAGKSYMNFTTPIVTALTWGVFPNKEIQQPTVYDSEVFCFWKEEAFKSWDEWIKIYDEGTDSDLISNKILTNVKNEYFLMTLVDNDFVKPRIFEVLEKFLSI